MSGAVRPGVWVVTAFLEELGTGIRLPRGGGGVVLDILISAQGVVQTMLFFTRDVHRGKTIFTAADLQDPDSSKQMVA